MSSTRRSTLMGALAAPFVAVLPRHGLAQRAAREVRVGFTQDALTLDPANHRNRETQTVIRNIHDGLLTRDANMAIQPEIAAAPMRALDPVTYEVAIRPGIRFHSGDPLTAEDVKFSLDRLTRQGAMAGATSPRRDLLGPLEATEVVDERTVRMRLSQPWALFPAAVPGQEIVNRRHVERVGQEGMQTRTDGCGPFRLVDWRRGEAVIMERFAEYYGGSHAIPPAGPAQVDRAIFRVIPENSSRVAALLAGEVDIVNDLPPSAIRQVEASRNAQVMRVNGTRTFFVAMNVAKPPFNDVRVRRALNHALDKGAIISRVLGGTATPLRGVMSPDSASFNADLPEYRFDLDRARALLAEAGVPQGTEMVIDTTGATREIAEAVAALLSRTGLRVRTQMWEGAVLNPMWTTSAERRRERDLYITSWGNATLDPSDIMLPTLRSGGRGNSAGYANPEVDRLLDAAEGEIDQDKRIEAYRRAQRIVAEDAPWIFLWLPQDLYGVSRRIEGWRPQADSRINLHRVRIVGVTLARVLERLVQLPVVLFGVSLIVFLMMTLTPGDPVEIMLADQRATEEQAAMLRRDLGLDRPLAERYLVFLGNALTGDFGLSFFHRRPVLDVIAERLPATIELTVVALLIAVLVAVPLGVAAAVRRDSWLDRGLSALALFGVSLPGFWFGILLILLFAVQLGWFPVGGRIPFDAEVARVTGFLLLDSVIAGRPDAFLRALSHLALPAITLGLPAAALLARVIRSSMAEVLAADYVLFAEAKGLSRRRVLYLHALRNALIPAVTVLAIETGQLLGGSMIVETVFGWPGLGRVVVESIFARNYPLVQAAILLYAVIYVMANFCADLLYAALNPKVRL